MQLARVITRALFAQNLIAFFALRHTASRQLVAHTRALTRPIIPSFLEKPLTNHAKHYLIRGSPNAAGQFVRR